MPVAVYHKIPEYQPEWAETHPELALTSSIKQTTSLLTNPLAAIAIDYRKGITKDYMPFVRAATSAKVKHMAVIIDEVENVITEKDGVKEIPATGLQFIDACAIEACRLFKGLLRMSLEVYCNYEGTEDHPSLPDLVEIPAVPDSDAIRSWIASKEDQDGRALKPFKAQVYASRRAGESAYTAQVNAYEGHMQAVTPPLFLHNASGARRVEGNKFEVTSDAKMRTGDIVSTMELPYVSSLRGTLTLKARGFGGPIRQLFSGAELGFAVGTLCAHGKIKLPIGVGKILPGAAQTGVRVTLRKPMPFGRGDNLIVSVSSKNGKRFCGSFEVAWAE